jgi:putative spermidine/putrescine transport system substrate-binding protein
MITRRTALKLGASVFAGAVLPAGVSLAGGDFKGHRVVYATWGGDYERAQVAAYCDTFEKATGADVVIEGPVSNEKVRVMLESGGADWQVICIDDGVMYDLGNKGLLSEVDTNIVDVTRIPEGLRYKYGVAVDLGALIIVYSKKTFTESTAPKTWSDVFDVEKFPGKRLFSSAPNGTLEVALLADGVAPNALYPLDVERALKKLDTIKNQTIFYDSYSQGQQLVVDGAAVLGGLFSNRVYTAVKNGAELGASWEGNVRNITPLVVPKAAAEQELCWALVNNMLDPRNQAMVANEIAVSPSNPQAIEFVKPELVPWLPANAENNAKGVTVDIEFWGANGALVTERWQEWLLT